MIYAEFNMDESRKKLSLNIHGHAGQSTKGNDIVCASASILAYTLAQNILYHRLQGYIKYEPTIKLKDGNAKISCICRNSEAFQEVAKVFCVIQTGFQLLTTNYPQFVVLKMFGEADN